MWPLTRPAPESKVPEAAPPAPPPAPASAPASVPPSSAEEVLRRVVEGTSAVTGHDFFRSLVRHLAAALGVRWAFAGELVPQDRGATPARVTGGPAADGNGQGNGNGNGHSAAPAAGDQRVRVLAFWDESRRDFSPGFDYGLADTPCEGVVARATCEHHAGVAAQFPRDTLLAEIGAEAYLGAPLLDTTGEPLGLVVVMHDRPLGESPLAPHAVSILRVFAARAAAELQRVRREEALQRAYESVRDSHRRYLVLADISPVGIFHTTADGQSFYVNRRGAEIVGVPPEQCRGRGWATHIHPEDRDRVLAEAAAARAAGTPFQCEYRFLHPDGRVVWVFGQFIAERDEAGRIAGYAGTLSDITRLKHDEQHIRESERRYHALAETTAVGIWQVSLPEGLTLYVNPKMREMLELGDGEDLVGRPYHPFFSPQALERVHSQHARRAAGESSTYEVELVGSRGTRRTVVIAGTPVAGPDGTVTSIIGAFTDITERRSMEQALRDANASLRESETRLRLLADQVPAILWTADTRLQCTSVQGAGLAALGAKPEPNLSLSLHELFGSGGTVAPENVPAMKAHRQALAGESCRYEHRWGGRTYQSQVEPLRDPGGHIIGVVGIALDITERKRSEEAVREARDLLEGRVRQRTDEIAAANEALRREIDERKLMEDELRQNQQRYASILNSQQTLISRSDPEGRITYVNAAHQRAFGSKVGDSVLAKVHPDDIEATRKASEDLTRPPYTFTLEQRCEVRGQWRTFLWQGGVIRDRSGKVVEYQGVGFDITERKRAEEMLHESSRRYRSAAEQARVSAEDARRAADEAGQMAEFNRRLALEVDHRVRNNLAGLLSLVSVMKERSKDVRSFATAIEGRLLAMHHVHQALADTDFKAVDLRSLVASLLAAVEKLATFPARVRVDGPSVPVPPKQTLPLSMILVEWFTNSCKYGAHTAHGGRLKVSWELVTRATSDAPEVKHVRLRWQEFGGPQIPGPVTPSLGTDLVRGFASRELGGRCELCYPLSGVDHMLEFPVE